MLNEFHGGYTLQSVGNLFNIWGGYCGLNWLYNCKCSKMLINCV
jgi:hypothetical protein